MASSTVTSAVMNMATATASAAHAAAASATTAASSMGMSMGGSSSANACKISMLWNWTTINSCFIARSWHVHSKGGFAGTCIGIVFMGILVELVRRVQRELDRHLLARWLSRQRELNPNVVLNAAAAESDASKSGSFVTKILPTTPSRALAGGYYHPSVLEQALRAFLYLLQYAGAYFIMLLAMYYNGYVIICIFIGGYIGNFVFGGDSFKNAVGQGAIETQKTCCC
jgi:copper transporter 1